MKANTLILIGLLCIAFNQSFSQLKLGDQPTIANKSVILDLQGSGNKQGLWLPRVIDTSVAGIRALNPPDGLVIYHTPVSGAANNKILLRSNNSWISYLTNAITGITAGQTASGPNVTFQTGTTGTDHNIVANSAANTVTFNLPDASTTARGAVTTAAQTFGGAKTFANGVTVNNGSTLNGVTTATGGLTVTGATTSTSNLTLGITSATTPAASTNQYLSVNSSGNVTLNSLNAVGGITSGGQTATGNVTFNTGTTGTDFNIAATGSAVNFNLPDASTTARGAVTTAAQTFGGAKTLANGVTVNNGSTLNGGTTANGGLTVSGATTSTSNLVLGITSATTPAASTNQYLSVNSTGNVTLNSLSAVSGITSGGQTATGNVTFNAGTAGTDHNIAIVGNTVTSNIPDASTTARGSVTTAAQTFGGAKTFANGVTVNNGATVNNGSTLNGGTTANGGLTVSGATTSTSNLVLGITSATTPAASTNQYLSVNSAGNVTLNALTDVTSITAGGTSTTGNVTFNTGTTGTDFNIAASGSAVNFNLPDASATARGAVTTGTQTLNGIKTFATGAVVSGSSSNNSNLKLGITSATTPSATITPNFLTVDASGNVGLATNNVQANKPTNMKSYTATVVSSVTINSGSNYIMTLNLPVGANVTPPAACYLSPSAALLSGTSINWVAVTGSNTVQVAFSASGSAQSFAAGYQFYLTVIDF